MQRAGEFYVSRDDLLQAGLPAEHLSQGEVNVSRLPQVTTQYDSSGQRLLLSVLQDWLPERATPFGGEARVNEARNSRGALLNYDFCSSHSQNGDNQASIWHELRFFNDVGSLSSTGYVRHILAGDGDRQDGYVRYDTVATTMQLNLTVTNDCITINAPNVNFGSAPLVKNFPAISQAVSIICTKGSSYTVGINNGSYANGNVRNMASGNNRLSYEIYKASTTNRWGSVGTERWTSSASSSTSSDGLLRTYNYTAVVLPSQSTPPAGTYTDTVVVDIAF